MPVFDASPGELRDALLNVHEGVTLDEPRRWYSALVLAVMVRGSALAEWRDWRVEPPRGSTVSMTPATMAAIEKLFSTSASALLRQTQVNGVAAHMGHPERMVLDPFRQGQAVKVRLSLCALSLPRTAVGSTTSKTSVHAMERQFSRVWPIPNGDAPEYKPSGDYQQQQGIYCGWPADGLFAAGTDEAEIIMSTPRPQCPSRQHVQKAVRTRRDAGPPELTEQWTCAFNGNQCAMKGAGSSSVGGPRALVPEGETSSKLLLTPGSFERILDDANAGNHPLPRMDDFALIVSYLYRGSGAALDFNRVHELISPDHTVVLFEHRV